MPEIKYKVGDKLIVRRDIPYFPVDTVVEIVEIDLEDSDMPYQGYAKGIGYSWFYESEMCGLKKLEETPQEDLGGNNRWQNYS